MRLVVSVTLPWILLVSWMAQPATAQSLQAPATSLRDPQVLTATPGSVVMVPFNPATQRGLYPSTGLGSTTFDPYASRPSYQNPGVLPSTGIPAYVPPYGTTAPGTGYPSTGYPSTSYPPSVYPNTGYPGTSYPGSTYPGSTYSGSTYPGTGSPGLFGNVPSPGSYPQAGYPTTAYPPATYPGPNGLSPGYPGIGQSGSIGNYTGSASGNFPPGMVPNSSPPSLFPTSIFGGGGAGGNWLGSIFGGSTNPYGYNPYGASPYGYGGAVNNGGILAPGAVGGASPYGNWNPQGSVAGVWSNQPAFVRFFQGPRFRHTYIYGNNDENALQINDSDLSLAFAIPNFLFSTQPLYILPSFSLHNWDGPNAPSPADLPSKAYSAFLDAGWQTDPLRLLGAELGVRVGVFSDFETFTSDSLRVMGRGLGRLRLTPTATLKGGVIYLDRNRVKLLPAGGILWQPNPATRFDLFFPEPKLAHYLNTVGNFDSWWYITGYYGGGAWTVKRTDGTKDSIDINDIRLMLGLEWGRNDQLRDGRRVGFMEVGYVFNRELLYKNSPADNIDLDDSFVVRAGIGY